MFRHTSLNTTQVVKILKSKSFIGYFFYSVAPYNVTITGDNTYSQGEQLELSCSSEGGPELEYTWTFSGVMIDNANTSMLTIANITTYNGGEYTCSVRNDAGSDNDSVTVYSKFFVCM